MILLTLPYIITLSLYHIIFKLTLLKTFLIIRSLLLKTFLISSFLKCRFLLRFYNLIKWHIYFRKSHYFLSFLSFSVFIIFRVNFMSIMLWNVASCPCFTMPIFMTLFITWGKIFQSRFNILILKIISCFFINWMRFYW